MSTLETLKISFTSLLFRFDFQMTKLPPSHMLIRQGHIVLKKPKKTVSDADDEFGSQSPVKCMICDRFIGEDRVNCTNTDCSLATHLICLSQRFVEPNEYVPINGSCPKCHQMMLWSDVVRKFKGYSDAIVLADDDQS